MKPPPHTALSPALPRHPNKARQRNPARQSAPYQFKQLDTTGSTWAKRNGRKTAIPLGKLVPRLGLEPIFWLSASLVIVAFRYVYLAVNMRHLPNNCKHYFTSRPNYGQKKLWGTLGGGVCLGNVWCC